ncbi:triglyceride lipase ATG15 Ecym_2493 [Eremothecium cymbalariae DBVPG|uniref:Putative lipase ATG15 n=1 Tax=Eremothecium cymbalariae (strain CBS 270.75 / DBVPG 7215 / KCTC 17166 / NRRL Y-17582) TaxID=931890 RepID=G8JPV7_ERECY|nr:Hypothetical protein Ecym_2493 [Eremothecium cymbalariae DBVPG\
MDEKEQRRLQRRRVIGAWRVPLLTGFLICLYYSYLYSYKFFVQEAYLIDKRNPQVGTGFRLTRIHHHGVGKDYGRHMVVDMNQKYMEAAWRNFEELVSANVDGEEELWTTNKEYAGVNPFNYTFRLKQDVIKMVRLAEREPDWVESYLDFARENPQLASKVDFDWVDDDVVAPNISDKETVISLALMSSNAYVKLPNTGDWRNITSWDNPDTEGDGGLGWDSDGLRAHVFNNEDNSIVVIAIKGTSSQIIPGSGSEGSDETSSNDKINDNLLFSCCCARVSYLWTTVCDCYMSSYTCDETCLEKELRRKDRYYHAALDLYRQVQRDFPHSTIWMTGHSLGGALSSLIGRTFGVPAVAFQAPGELLAAKRLHLPQPPGLPPYTQGLWNFGHTADPIFMGTCNGASSSCSMAGYAMETSCHMGKSCVYDVVNDSGWHVNLLNHRIHTVIDEILMKYDHVAFCKEAEPCHDCHNWDYIRYKGDQPQKSPSLPSSTSRATITTISTTPDPSSSSTSTSTSASCKGRNWFGFCTEYATIHSTAISNSIP